MPEGEQTEANYKGVRGGNIRKAMAYSDFTFHFTSLNLGAGNIGKAMAYADKSTTVLYTSENVESSQGGFVAEAWFKESLYPFRRDHHSPNTLERNPSHHACNLANLRFQRTDHLNEKLAADIAVPFRD
ncbi:hypothetical protein GH714_042434 [Hevea brasiliensis]|uniref:Uncharacterized protein n=1 Tax=Hevea brasiliensis TaxID=3981 RepID=A0A6A6MGT6_HEVBR|nr:hypothetical protein GH714_042434 [Hevea brasiliensis]